MIRSINTPLLKEWTVTRVSKSASTPAHSFSRCKHYSNIPFIMDNSSRSYLLVSVPSRSHSGILRSRRRYSTFPEQQRKVKQGDGLPPIGTPQSSKPKVDLRPAPKKVIKEARTSSPPPPQNSVVPQSQSAPDSSSLTNTESIQQSSEHLGAIESTKYDFNDAVRRGVFKPPPEGASKPAVLWHNLKQYFWFYYGGLKLVLVTHRNQVGAIKNRIREAKAKGEDVSMTRSETRFVRQYKRDLLKLLPFVLTLAVLEEAIPFIVLYAPGLLPSTCLLPSQRERIEAKRRTKQRSHMAILKSQLDKLQSISTLSQRGVSSLSSELSQGVAGVLARWTYGPSFFQHNIISRHLRYIAEDDTLLSRENNGASLQDGELTEALEERGMIWGSSLSRQEKLAMLQWWLKGAQDESSRLQLVLQFVKDAKIASS